MAVVRQIIRYRGDTDEARLAALTADSAARAAAGWTVAAQATEYVFGAVAPELVVTYERESGAPLAGNPAAAPAAPAAPGNPYESSGSGTFDAPPAAWAYPAGQWYQPDADVPPPAKPFRLPGILDRAWLRRLLIIGSPILFVAFSGLTPHSWDGIHPVADYAWIGVEITLAGTLLLGLGLYAGRWKLIHPGIWRTAAIALAVTAALCGLAAATYFAYAVGLDTPPPAILAP